MSHILKLVLLSTLCAMATATTFFWVTFEALKGEGRTNVDFSDIKMEDLTSELITYLHGKIVVTKVLTNGPIQVYYQLQNLSSETKEVVDSQSGEPHLCDFLNGFSLKNLLPMFDHHNDFPDHSSSQCEVPVGTYHIFDVYELEQVEAESALQDGLYDIDVMYKDEGKSIGGFKGRFYSQRNIRRPYYY